MGKRTDGMEGGREDLWVAERIEGLEGGREEGGSKGEKEGGRKDG